MKHFIAKLTVCILALSVCSHGQVPQKISYQGLLTTSPGGAAVPNGSYDLKFEIYNAPTGGTLRHSETHSGVDVTRGTFSVVLGPLPPIFTESLYVEVTALSGPSIGSPLTFLPRAELTSAPYALAPWSINGSDISYSSGNVGIGTNSPQAKLHVAVADEAMRIQGSVSGVLNQTYLTFYNGAGTRVGYVGDGSTGDNSVFLDADIGDVVLNTSAGRVLTATSTGNVGIGTTTPQSKLEVRGDIRFGPSGEYRAPGGEENLRIIRGVVTAAGGIIVGSGFTVSHVASSGTYVINFNTAFPSAPSVAATAQVQPGLVLFATTDGVVSGSATIRLWNPSNLAGSADGPFHFIAIGPR